MDRSASGHKKTVLLTIALLAVGMYFLPATLSIFSGQHTFVNGSQVSCKECHEDVYSEIKTPDMGEQLPHWSFGESCTVCHRTGGMPGVIDFAMSPGYKETNVSTNPNAHAAVTVECVFCHDLIVNDGSGNPQGILGSEEAHASYYNASNQTSLLKGGNEACVGCHTHTRINVVWRRIAGYGMNANLTSGSWNISYSLNQTLVNTTSSG